MIGQYSDMWGLLGGGRPPHEWVNLGYDWIFKVCVDLQLQSLILQCNYNVCTKKFKKSHGGPDGEKKRKEKKEGKKEKQHQKLKEAVIYICGLKKNYTALAATGRSASYGRPEKSTICYGYG